MCSFVSSQATQPRSHSSITVHLEKTRCTHAPTHSPRSTVRETNHPCLTPQHHRYTVLLLVNKASCRPMVNRPLPLSPVHVVMSCGCLPLIGSPAPESHYAHISSEIVPISQVLVVFNGEPADAPRNPRQSSRQPRPEKPPAALARAFVPDSQCRNCTLQGLALHLPQSRSLLTPQSSGSYFLPLPLLLPPPPRRRLRRRHAISLCVDRWALLLRYALLMLDA